MAKCTDKPTSPTPVRWGQLQALGALFADAFATYTVRVLAEAEQEGIPLSDILPATCEQQEEEGFFSGRGRRSPYCPPVGGSAADPEQAGAKPSDLESAPAWVREAYNASLVAGSPRVSAVEARERTLRNQLMVALREQGCTQAELARRAKMKPASVSRILRAPERSRLDTLERLAKALKLDLPSLLAQP